MDSQAKENLELQKPLSLDKVDESSETIAENVATTIDESIKKLKNLTLEKNEKGFIKII